MKKVTNFLCSLLLVSVFGFIFSNNLVLASSTTTQVENGNYQQQIESITTRQNEMSDRAYQNADRILQYSKDTINYFLIILGLLVSFSAILGWNTFRNVKSSAKEKINKIAKEEIKRVSQKLSSKVDDIDSEFQRKNIIYSLWQNYAYENNPKSKLTIIEKIISKSPKDNKAYGTKGILLSQLDKCDEALEYFDKAIELKNDDEIAYMNKAMCLKKLEKHEESIAVLNKAISVKSDIPDFYNEKADNLIKLKKYDDAIASIDMAIKINPGDAKYFNTKADIYLEMKKYQEAIDCYKKAREVEGSYHGECNFNSYQINISYAYYRLRNFTQAYKEASIGLNIGYSTELAVNKGLAAAGLGKSEEAIELLHSALAIGWRNDDVLYCQAKMYGLLKYKDKCLEALKQAVGRNKKFIEEAKNEPDFSFVSSTPEFIEIIK